MNKFNLNDRIQNTRFNDGVWVVTGLPEDFVTENGSGQRAYQLTAEWDAPKSPILLAELSVDTFFEAVP